MAKFKKYYEYEAELASKYRFFKVIPREESLLMKVAYYGLLMFLWNKDFLTGYVTTVGFAIYMPRDLVGTKQGYITLRHEAVHVRDFLYSGMIPFVVSYALLLPAGLTFRSLWEKRGYAEQMRAYYEVYGKIPNAILDQIAVEFTGSTYLWMWPFKKDIRNWLERKRTEIISE
jgi:hypothetical protein